MPLRLEINPRINRPFMSIEDHVLDSDALENFNIKRGLVSQGLRLLERDEARFYDFYRRLYLNKEESIINTICSAILDNSHYHTLRNLKILDNAMQKMDSYDRSYQRALDKARELDERRKNLLINIYNQSFMI